jgi:hypothetical protein
MHPMRQTICHHRSWGGGPKGTTYDSKVAKGEAFIDAKKAYHGIRPGEASPFDD